MYVQTSFKTQSLMRAVNVHVILPFHDGYPDAETPFPTLYFLSGFSANAEEMVKVLPLRQMSSLYGVAIIIPDGENSFYTNHPERVSNMGHFVAKELVEITRKIFPQLSHKREDTFIGGVSMGGYGAVVHGLRVSDTFSRILMMSPAIEPDKLFGYDLDTSGAVPSQLFNALFDGENSYRNSSMNPRKTLLKMKEEGKDIPLMYLCCGKQDMLVHESCASFRTFLEEQGVPLSYEEGDGFHDISYWDEKLDACFRFLTGRNSALDTSVLETSWKAPNLPNEPLKGGDMPGDKICITEEHIGKANLVFPNLLPMIKECLDVSARQRMAISVCGGSGVGKSEIATLLAFYLRQIGVGVYILSGDNYPHRIPRDNDAERVRVFRTGGLRALAETEEYCVVMSQTLRILWKEDRDAEPELCTEYPWLKLYQQAGRECLKGYLGTRNEIDFDEVSFILTKFKGGADNVTLKRMGRKPEDLWYDVVDMSQTQVLILEWTHGNSDYITGVDLPVLLNSTPEETLAHRRTRNRDGKTDSAFTTMVLGLEQDLLASQAHKACIILTNSGELLPAMPITLQ